MEIKPIPGFSALKFKEECQARVQAELEGLSPEEEAAKLNHDAANGPFGEWWRTEQEAGGGRDMTKLRVYIDTSVAGGCFDEEFAEWSKGIFEKAINGEILLVLSDVFFRELEGAPQQVQDVVASLPESSIEVFAGDENSDRLHSIYLAAGIVGAASENDALHVANASVAGVDVVVSWNMKHIVHYEKIIRYNQVNTFQGYRSLVILTPKEVV